MLASILPAHFLPTLLNSIAHTSPSQFNALILATIASAMTIFLWTTTTRLTALYILSSLYGLSSVIVLTLLPTTIAGISEQSDGKSCRGAKSGKVVVTMGMSLLTGLPVAGTLVDRGGSEARRFLWGQVFAGVILLVGVGCFVLAGWLRGEER